MRLNVFVPASRLKGLRRGLGRLCPSWVSSPVRRVAQAISLAAFLWLFLHVCRAHGERDFAAALSAREIVPAEAFLRLDPLVSISAAVAGRALAWGLLWVGGLLVACLFFPRGFCGYVCPLGTLIDLSDWAVGGRLRRLHLKRRGWWVHLRYWLLAGVLVAAAMGVMLSGAFAALPVLTRGLTGVVEPLHVGLTKGWAMLAPVGAGQVLAVALLAMVLGLGALGRRFWCRCVCPSGTVLSLFSVLRLTDRKVRPSCIGCGKCVEACSFDAIGPDFATRASACTFCQDCGGVCPVGAVEFTGRRDRGRVRAVGDSSPGGRGLSRRGFLAGAAASAAGAAGISAVLGAVRDASAGPIRPPGSVPEEQFLRLCVRCGECFNACPTGLLRPVGLGSGLERLWTPRADTDFSACAPSCNVCGQVCPTGAIRPMPLADKRIARMGLAGVDQKTCLPWAGRGDCRMCVDACGQAGYEALEFRLVHPELDEFGMPVEGSGYLAPFVLTEKCVGCGRCQSTCYHVNAVGKRLLAGSAIRVRVRGVSRGPHRERTSREVSAPAAARASAMSLRNRRPSL